MGAPLEPTKRAHQFEAAAAAAANRAAGLAAPTWEPRGAREQRRANYD